MVKVVEAVAVSILQCLSNNMNFKKLNGFIKQAIESDNPFMQHQGLLTQKEMMDSQEDEEVVAPDLEGKSTQKEVEPEDQLLMGALKEMYMPDANDKSTFGKTDEQLNDQNSMQEVDPMEAELQSKEASAYVRDVPVSELPADIRADIAKFVSTKDAKVIQYGMVVKELLSKVDHHNYDQAEAHIRKDFRGQDRDKLRDEFFQKAKKKFILILNDSIVDGHHFLAKADALGVTNSLNVLDLTPTRFQKTASVWELLVASYGNSHNSR